MTQRAVASASVRRQLASDLLRIGAVSLAPDKPFTWSSGRRAPIYCDNRLTMAHPEVRERIAGGFEEQLTARHINPDVVAGTATAGIPHAAWLAGRLGKPMVYVRSKAKEHGRGRQIEGQLQDGQHVVLIEDLISTGGSALEAAHVLQERDAVVDAVMAVFTYGLSVSSRRFEEQDVLLYTLTDFDTLLDVAAEEGRLDASSLDVLRRWQEDPEGWSGRA